MLKMTLIERIDSAEKRSEMELDTNNHEQVMMAIVGLFAFFGVEIPQDALIPHGETIRGKFAEMAKMDQEEQWTRAFTPEEVAAHKAAIESVSVPLANNRFGPPPTIQETIKATVKEIEDQGGVVTSIKVEDGQRQGSMEGRMTYSMADKLGPLLGALQGGGETAATAAAEDKAEERGITVPGDENPLHQPEIEVPGIKVEPKAAEPDPADQEEDIDATVDGRWPYVKYRNGEEFYKCRYYCTCGHKSNRYIKEGSSPFVKCFECRTKLEVRDATEYEKDRLNTRYMANKPYRTVEQDEMATPEVTDTASDPVEIQEAGMDTVEVHTPTVTIQIGTTTKGKQNEQPPEGSGWKLRKCQTMHKCDDCGELINARHTEYYQKGSSRKRFCPDCFKDKILPRLCVQCHQEKELLMLDDNQGICDDCAQHMSDMAPGGDQE